MASAATRGLRYHVDENLRGLGRILMQIRSDVAVTGVPVPGSDEPLVRLKTPDVDWIPTIGELGLLVITNDGSIRTRPVEAQLAVQYNLKVVHLFGKVGEEGLWAQLQRLVGRWHRVEQLVADEVPGPWWLSLRPNGSRRMDYEPGKPERRR